MLPRWRIRYCDGTSFTNQDGTPFEAPATGVQTIVQWNPRTGREILRGFDIYYWMNDLNLWWAGDIMGYFDLAASDTNVKAPKRGLNCREYQARLDETVTDPDFDPTLRAFES